MANPQILTMPVELALELMAVIGADGVDTKGEFGNHVVYETAGIELCVTSVDLDGPDPGGIIHRGVLKPPYPLAAGSLEIEKLDIHLDVMSGDLFGISFG